MSDSGGLHHKCSDLGSSPSKTRKSVRIRGSCHEFSATDQGILGEAAGPRALRVAPVGRGPSVRFSNPSKPAASRVGISFAQLLASSHRTCMKMIVIYSYCMLFIFIINIYIYIVIVIGDQHSHWIQSATPRMPRHWDRICPLAERPGRSHCQIVVQPLQVCLKSCSMLFHIPTFWVETS